MQFYGQENTEVLSCAVLPYTKILGMTEKSINIGGRKLEKNKK